MVEIMIVVAIIAILAAIAIPQLIESRKMSRLNKCMNNLKLYDYATAQAALNLGAASSDYVAGGMLTFIKDGVIECPSGGGYDCGHVDEPAFCTYHGSQASPTPLSALTND